ncbi:hypothetical protein BASA81_009059 [Batrachochytrium salamandrivorans]|nr:hypothetical protein BASA81_009059 [Batrachochytrium salamandrivorans]
MEAPAAEPSPKIEAAPPAASPPSSSSPCGCVQLRWKNYWQRQFHPQHKLIFRCELFLFVMCLVALVVIVGTVSKLFTDAPFEPIFWGFVVGLVLYFFFSILLVGVWSRSNKFTLKRITKSVRFWVFIVSVLAALVCLLLVLYFILPESFHSTADVQLVQLRSVTTTTAALFLRNPDGCSQAVARYRAPPQLLFIESTNRTTDCTHAVDHTSFLYLTDLSPGTQYEVMINVTETHSQVLQFKTNPDSSTKQKFSFYFGSCFLLLDRLFANDNSGPFRFLTDVVKPDLFLFLGDFVYADVPFYNTDSELKYQSLYRRSLLNPQVNRLLQTTPNYFMWDDHEVANDYPYAITSNLFKINEYSFNKAFKLAWEVFLGGGNPEPVRAGTNTTYFSFNYGDSAFFFLDTRLYRDKNTTLLGAEQLVDLLAFLSVPINGFKFVLSPVGLTNDFAARTNDAWAGYLTERNAILDYIDQQNVSRVVFLSGDSHFAYANELRGKVRPSGSRKIYEVSASPIAAFDYTIGGLYSGVTFLPESQREDNVLFETKGAAAMPSLLGVIRVDTTLAEPEIDIDLYDDLKLVYTLKLNSTQLM